MKKELWLRLKHYHFEHIVPPDLLDHVTAAFGRTDASTRAFAAKIARKLDWSTAFSIRAIDEYKKFLFLGVVSDFPVTPSKVIDEVWHEHLLFSRAYREFCRDVLHREFDHNPELLPSQDQTSIFAAQYLATLELYADEFRVKPPAEIWNTPKFGKAGAQRLRRTVSHRDADGSHASSDAPLYSYFDGSGGSDSASDMAEFGGAGGFSGGGRESSCGDSSSSSNSEGDSASDSSSSDGGSSDSGSSCSSGCSSGCGGGGE